MANSFETDLRHAQAESELSVRQLQLRHIGSVATYESTAIALADRFSNAAPDSIVVIEIAGNSDKLVTADLESSLWHYSLELGLGLESLDIEDKTKIKIPRSVFSSIELFGPPKERSLGFKIASVNEATIKTYSAKQTGFEFLVPMEDDDIILDLYEFPPQA